MSGASKRDREKLRERVKTELRKQGLSQKELEEAAGLASGTLTRVFNGRRAMDAEVAGLLVAQLGLAPAELFAGTSFLAEFGEHPEVVVTAVAADVAPATATERAPEPEPAPTAGDTEPLAEAAEPAPAVADPEPAVEAPVPAPRTAAPEAAYVPPPPPPEPEPRSRKRDLPLKVVRFVFGKVFGRA